MSYCHVLNIRASRAAQATSSDMTACIRCQDTPRQPLPSNSCQVKAPSTVTRQGLLFKADQTPPQRRASS